MTEIPQGWYPDPATQDLPGRSARMRYWDGATWTEHQHDPVKATPDGQPLAEWWHRVGAALLDGVILMPVMFLAMAPVIMLQWDALAREFRESMRAAEAGVPAPAPAVLEAGSPTMIMLTAVTVLVSATYTLGFWRYKQATPGKMVLGLRLRRRDTPGPMPWSTMLIRYAVVSFAGFTYGLPWLYWLLTVALIVNYLWPLWDSKNQAIHDKLAKTNVVRVR